MYIDKKIRLINYFIAFLPLAIILGNLIININIILICLFGFIIYKKEIFFLEKKKYQFLIYAFFLYIVLISLINYGPKLQIDNIYKENFLKSIFFLRFLILFLVINKLIEKKRLNIYLFYISCAFFSFFLSIDIIIQIIFGKDLIGNEITAGRPSGFFGTENIAGGYLQKFVLFLIFYLILNLKSKKNFLWTLILFTLFAIPILVTGNRMPSLIFGMCFLLYFLIEAKIKYFFLVLSFIIATLFILLFFPVNEKVSSKVNVFVNDSIEILEKAPKLFIYNSFNNEKIKFGGSGYLIHFNSGIQIWKNNKIFGQGLKSFPLKCTYENNQTCNTHPHNYFIELMLDTGLIGLVLIYSIFIYSLKDFFKYYLKNSQFLNRTTSVPFFLIIFFEFFPLRSTGSFFTTNNAVLIFFILAFFINSEKIEKLNFFSKNKS